MTVRVESDEHGMDHLVWNQHAYRALCEVESAHWVLGGTKALCFVCKEVKAQWEAEHHD